MPANVPIVARGMSQFLFFARPTKSNERAVMKRMRRTVMNGRLIGEFKKVKGSTMDKY
jgi:hypothetical protein